MCEDTLCSRGWMGWGWFCAGGGGGGGKVDVGRGRTCVISLACRRASELVAKWSRESARDGCVSRSERGGAGFLIPGPELICSNCVGIPYKISNFGRVWITEPSGGKKTGDSKVGEARKRTKPITRQKLRTECGDICRRDFSIQDELRNTQPRPGTCTQVAEASAPPRVLKEKNRRAYRS